MVRLTLEEIITIPIYQRPFLNPYLLRDAVDEYIIRQIADTVSLCWAIYLSWVIWHLITMNAQDHPLPTFFGLENPCPEVVRGGGSLLLLGVALVVGLNGVAHVALLVRVRRYL